MDHRRVSIDSLAYGPLSITRLLQVILVCALAAGANPRAEGADPSPLLAFDHHIDEAFIREVYLYGTIDNNIDAAPVRAIELIADSRLPLRLRIYIADRLANWSGITDEQNLIVSGVLFNDISLTSYWNAESVAMQYMRTIPSENSPSDMYVKLKMANWNITKKRVDRLMQSQKDRWRPKPERDQLHIETFRKELTIP